MQSLKFSDETLIFFEYHRQLPFNIFQGQLISKVYFSFFNS